jgi:hypothetical protein
MPAEVDKVVAVVDAEDDWDKDDDVWGAEVRTPGVGSSLS